METKQAPASPCCIAGAQPRDAVTAESGAPIESGGREKTRDAIRIPGGRAVVGTDRPEIAGDGEGPSRTVALRPFLLDATAVTNARFARFVAETGHVTDAERFGWSFVFRDLVRDEEPRRRVVGAEWWVQVEGAAWNRPAGPRSDLVGLDDHPVVHVSGNDAAAFASWAGGRLPSEAEWEHAAQGGRPGARFPWGSDEPDDTGVFPCNIWQGRFPLQNTAADGWSATAPARSFEPNRYGLYNLCGNVWEWTADRFRIRSLGREAKRLNEISAREDRRVLKGGSFLCHRSYCYRYRIAARIGNPPDTSTAHTGFRLAYHDEL